MSSSTISNLVFEANNLNYVAMMFIRCFCYVVIPLGIIGHLLNVYVLTRPSLLSNPCSRYFLAASIVGLINTVYPLPMRLIQSGFPNTDPGAHSVVFCKITWLLLNSIRASAFWLIVWACADRYLCSCASTNKRSWSSVRVANRIIPLTILMATISYIHIAIFFNISIIPATQQPICYPTGPPGTYRMVLSYFNLIFLGLSPGCCMLGFGLLTLRNVERSKRLVVMPSTNLVSTTNQTNRKTNRQMLRMLIFQVLVYSITGLAFCIGWIYITIIAIQPQNVYQLAQQNMINAVVGMLSNVGPCLSFYLFTLSSSLFRKELKNLFCRHNLIGNLSQQAAAHISNTGRPRIPIKT